jgi:AraC family transcriptional regulator, regulatory protein of adaptative response / methylated-DNA-[protein]-cysteine methyltransferase
MTESELTGVRYLLDITRAEDRKTRTMNRQSHSYVRYMSRNGELAIADATYGPYGRGARVTYTIVDSPFGRILVAATARGVCWVGIHESGARLEAELRDDFHAAEVIRDNDAVRGLACNIVDYVNGESLELPLDIRATPFRRDVWRELCAIPWGTTRSYGEIARRLGRPGASRAVGHANGSNPVAIVIPCHRAIGADGTLTGYRWGLACKRRLLDHERALAQSSLLLGARPATPK